MESLLKPENANKLNGILAYHVAAGKIMSADIFGKTAMVQTLRDGKLTVNATNGEMVDQATVTAVYVEASKGAIHGIDQVVLPN